MFRWTPVWAAVALGVFASAARAQDLAVRIDEAVQHHVPAIVELRHRIHLNPELSNREVETARLVAEHLGALGLEVETGVAKTGVVAILRGGRPGPVVAVRADMDALPVVERSDLPFRSTVRTEYLGQEVGVAHACGHDVHTAVQLGVASVLADLGAELPGTVVFLFQPAEEGPPPGEEGGARLMIEEGALEEPRPEAIFALHSFPQFEVGGETRVGAIGQVGWAAGPTYASSDHFIVTIRGKQAHGAWPHLSVDPIVTAAEAILALQTIRSRNLPPTEPGVVTVGIIRGGERNNIIPETVRLEGTVRTYDQDVRDLILRRIEEILDGVTRAAGASYELEIFPYAPPVVNDSELAVRMRPTMERVVGAENVLQVDPVMGAEDFAWYAREVPGFYWRLGVVEEGTTSGALHTPDFRAGDGAVPVGIRVMANLVVDYLRGAGEAR
jgi:amidohydrolase